MAKYDIYNPTKATRVIYDGIPKDGKNGGTQSAYNIPPGGKREGVELSDEIAKDLVARTKGESKHEIDLRLTPSEERGVDSQPRTDQSSKGSKR